MIEADIIIIGGGAAGLMAAARLVGKGIKTVLLEKNRVCGAKILITGKGRCNITNYSQWDDFQTHIHPDKDFFKTAFYSHSNHETLTFFEKMGLQTLVERGDRVFPVSGRSSDVRDALVNYINRDSAIQIYTSAEVGAVKKTSEGVFRVDAIIHGEKFSSMLFSAKKLIICTGGLSYPLTGSTGDGLRFAQSFGLSVEETYPSLTALKPASIDKQLEGLILRNVKLDLWVNGALAQTEFGEVAFTDGGIEGALGFRVSRKGVRALMDGQRVEVVLDLKPALDVQQLAARITRELAEYKKAPAVKTILKSLLPEQMIDSFIKDQKTPLTLQNLPVRLKEWKIKIVGYVGYERAVVTVGGVSLDEISRKTMESKKIEGLYFAGETMNLDADTGGYNLQIAFSTGALAADSAAKSMKTTSL